MKLGIESLLEDAKLVSELESNRVGLLGHPSSVDKKLNHSIDTLFNHSQINLTCAFGPQHGMKGDKQYNMEETPDELDPKYNIPVFSLYGEVRRPTAEMMSHFDVLLFDLQDVGCRIYTYVATLVYMLEACAQHKKSLWILDRPNPVGRKVEGSYLLPEWKSFVGEVELPMRHGLTLGELARWYVNKNKLDVDLKIVKMQDYDVNHGWAVQVPWVNPSPQIPNVKSCRVYNGSVLLEATELSEGRGTTTPLEVLGAPDLPVEKILGFIDEFAPSSIDGGLLRECFFVPFFNKHKGQLCNGIQVHTDDSCFDDQKFNPYRLFAVLFKSIKHVCPEKELWAQFHYEYEKERLPIDLLTGSEYLKKWVNDSESTYKDLNNFLGQEEQRWQEERKPFLIY